MSTRTCLCFSVLLCILFSQTGLAQDNRRPRMPIGSTADPFAISEGSSFSASGAGLGPSGSGRLNPASISADYQEALNVISANYAGPGKPDASFLTAASVTSMLKSLDPHSNYFDPSEFQEMLDEHESEFTGTGSSIAAFEKGGVIDTFVVSTLPESPASKAGLRFGDKILSVDGRSTAGLPPDAVRAMLRGKPGTSARITIEPAGGGPARMVEIGRERLHEPAVPAGFDLGGGVGYIDLTSGFSNATYAEFEAALNGLKSQGARSLIIDLRGNGGGILEQAIKVAERLLPKGSLIVSQRGRYPGENREWRSTNTKYESMPLVLLVDEHSASATEVLAGALQDNDRALIVGRKTFGKGLVQSVLPLPRGAGLTLTAARYFTPSGRSIQRDYADTGLYDYYRHKGEANIDKPLYASRTVTKRIVYGGDGIAPDETSDGGKFTAARIGLLDPLFFFTRENADPAASDRSGGLRETRRKILFREPIADEATLAAFGTFIDSDEKWKSLRPHVQSEKQFVRGMLAYYLAMAAFGAETADQARIEADPAVLLAVNALPRSAQLAANARKARNTKPKEKSSSSLVLDERR